MFVQRPAMAGRFLFAPYVEEITLLLICWPALFRHSWEDQDGVFPPRLS
jgi:hypothetical protein